MKTHPHELLIIFDAGSPLARRTLAYAHTLSRHVREIEYNKSSFTDTLWRQLISKLDVEPKELLDKSHPYYQINLRGRSFDEEGWLTVIRRNTHLIKAPIAVMGKKAILCTNPTLIFSLLQEQKVAVPNAEL